MMSLKSFHFPSSKNQWTNNPQRCTWTDCGRVFKFTNRPLSFLTENFEIKLCWQIFSLIMDQKQNFNIFIYQHHLGATLQAASQFKFCTL